MTKTIRIAQILAPNLERCGEFAYDTFISTAEKILQGEPIPRSCAKLDKIAIKEIVNEEV